MTRYFEGEAKIMGDCIVKSMNDTYMEANKKNRLAMVQELIQFPIHATLQRLP